MTEMQEMSIFEAMYTQRAIRHFSDRPVSEDDINKILDAAIRAPSGTNTQPWRFVVVRSKETKSRLGEWYLDAWQNVTANMSAEQREAQPVRYGANLAEGMSRVPVVILVCMEDRRTQIGPGQLVRGASIYPAAQNLMLAARALGLGTVITTIHTRHEAEIKVLLNMPENVEIAAMIPVGHPAEGEVFKRGRRRPLREVVFNEAWNNTNPRS